MARLKRIGKKIYDFGTSNNSFLQLAVDLRTLGVKNWAFMLELKDPSLISINPYSVDKKTGRCNLTKDQIERVITECTRNPWYYLREVARIPDPGNPNGVPYKANRGNIAQVWCLLHGIDSWLNLPRQQGKTQSALAIINWGYSYGTSDTSIIFVNKQQPDAKTNLQRTKDQIDLLPEYLRFESFMDDETGKVVKAIKNATTLRHPVTKTSIIVRAGAGSPEKAVSLGRGLTAPIIHYDEVEFTDYIELIVDNSLSTYETAARASKDNGSLYGRIFTSTPGDLDSKAGKGAQLIIDRCVNWNEKMYDMTQEEMEKFANAGNSNGIVYIEFMYYQIGLDKEWLKKFRSKYTSELTFRREVLLQRLHGSQLSPYPQEDIDMIAEKVRKPINVLLLREYYQFKVYSEWDPRIPYILGIDCSTGTNNDFNAITVINPYTEEVVGEFECSFIGEPEYERLIVELVQKYLPRSIIVIERNNIGDGILAHLMESPIANRLYFDRAKNLMDDSMRQYETIESMLKRKAAEKTCYGVYTEGRSRDDMFGILATRIIDNKDQFIGENLTRDITRLIRKPSGRIEAGPGSVTNSALMRTLIVW